MEEDCTNLMYRIKPGSAGEKILIVGTGTAARLFVERLHNSKTHHLIPVGFLDDSDYSDETEILGVSVLGGLRDIDAVAGAGNFSKIVIAIDSDSPLRRKEIMQQCMGFGAEVNILPIYTDLRSGYLQIGLLRKVNVEDFLGRDRVSFNAEKIEESLEGTTILISGAGGSIGSEIARQLVQFGPKRLILVGHGENSIYQIHREVDDNYRGVEIVPVIRDIKEAKNLEEVFIRYRPDIVYHAAAHKHVPLMELNPKEAVRNNVFGTKNIADLSDQYRVQRFVMLSTDKAVNPTSIMGATKRLAEEYIRNLNQRSITKYVSVRFGNVIGSRGSVIPLFQEQIEKGGPITITDSNMTRYFMAIPEAASLVIQAGEISEDGEIFVLDMGEKVRIYDLALEMVRLAGYKPGDIAIEEIGIRNGEKITEEYIASTEKITRKAGERIFVARAPSIGLEKLNEYLAEILLLSEEEVQLRTISFANSIGTAH